MSTSYRTLNADPAFVAPDSAFLNGHAATWRWSWHTRVHVLMLVLMIAMAVPYLGVWAWHNADFAETADAAGAVTVASTTAKTFTAPLPACSNKQTCFIRTFLPWARKASQQTGWPVALILAQGANETSWSLPSFDGWNWGNAITFTPSDGPTCYGGGTVNGFCNAPTPDIGLRIFVHVAKLGFYSQVPTAAKQGDEAAARALGNSPWAESGYDNGNGRGSSLVAIMRQFSLTQYDK